MFTAMYVLQVTVSHAVPNERRQDYIVFREKPNMNQDNRSKASQVQYDLRHLVDSSILECNMRFGFTMTCTFLVHCNQKGSTLVWVCHTRS